MQLELKFTAPFFSSRRSWQTTSCPLLICQSRTFLGTKSLSSILNSGNPFVLSQEKKKPMSKELCEQRDPSPRVASGAGEPYCSCWVMSFQTILHSVAPAKPQLSSHMQPVLVSGDHHVHTKKQRCTRCPGRSPGTRCSQSRHR